MGKNLDALLKLQGIERQLTQVGGRLRSRQNAVTAQEHRIRQLQQDLEALEASSLEKRKHNDGVELELRTREQQVAKLRTNLNTAKTNKEYAAILTQINTHKADNAKLEEEVLKAMGDVDTIKAQADEVRQHVQTEQGRLEEIRSSSQAEIERLEKMMADLSARRGEAAKEISPETLSLFERMSESHEGEAMAPIEVHGKKPPHTYICGGCYMGLNAEHVNALRVRDEIRTCDNCGRILFLEPQAEQANR